MKKFLSLLSAAALLVSLVTLLPSASANTSEKIDLTYLYEPWRLASEAGERMRGWDEQNQVIKVSHSYEDQWMGGTGKGFLLDGVTAPGEWAAGVGLSSKGFFVSADNIGATINTTPDVNEWVEINLQKTHTVDAFAFYGFYQLAGDLTGFPTDFKILVSATGEDGSWTEAASETGYQPAAGQNKISFTPVECQYIRFEVSKIGAVFAGSSGGYDLILTELEVYGSEGSAVPPEFEGDFITAADSNIRYIGRWIDNADNSKTSYWGSAVIEFSFTGKNLRVVLDPEQSQSFIASIDGGAIAAYEAVNGEANLTPLPLADGTHTVKIITPVNRSGPNGELGKPFVLKGIRVDKGAATVKAEDNKKLMEIVGDSISDGWYGVRVTPYAAELLLGYNTVNIAYAGITLTDGIPNWTMTSTGMEKQYFKLTNDLSDANAADWSFTGYQPDAILINIGTNDFDKGVSEADFQVTYQNFLAKVREKNPSAVIYAVSPFGGFVNGAFHHFMEEPIRNAVAARIKAGDQKLAYIDTAGWLTAENARSYLQDDLHPNAAGIGYLGEKLAAAIRAADESLGKEPENPSSTPNTESSAAESTPSADTSSSGTSSADSKPSGSSEVPKTSAAAGLALMTAAATSAAGVMVIQRKRVKNLNKHTNQKG